MVFLEQEPGGDDAKENGADVVDSAGKNHEVDDEAGQDPVGVVAKDEADDDDGTAEVPHLDAAGENDEEKV